MPFFYFYFLLRSTAQQAVLHLDNVPPTPLFSIPPGGAENIPVRDNTTVEQDVLNPDIETFRIKQRS